MTLWYMTTEGLIEVPQSQPMPVEMPVITEQKPLIPAQEKERIWRLLVDAAQT